MREDTLAAPRISTGMVALTVALPDRVDPLALAAGREDFAIFWERPSTELALAGFGIAAEAHAGDHAGALALLDRLQAHTLEFLDGPAPPGPWFGGLAFDLDRPSGEGWRGFPAARFILPRVAIWTRAGRSWATAIGEDRAALRAALDPFFAAINRAAWDRPSIAAISPVGDERAWGALIESALVDLARGDLSKVVLARAIDVASPAHFDPPSVLSRLRDYAPECATFLLRGGAGSIFVGATPETLCRLDGATLATEALAGSIDPESPRAWLDRDKERREHDAVTAAIVEGLRPLSSAVEVALPTELALRNIRHRRTPIAARLRDTVTLGEVVRVLHPTPAVGGSPREAALAFLRRHEALDRGWYAGAVGSVGAGAAELCVALRSALLDGDRARLFVGAGVIAGSTAAGEWEETRLKSLPMLDALGAAP